MGRQISLIARGADIDMLLDELRRMGYRVLNDRGEPARAGEIHGLYIAPEGARIELRSDDGGAGYIDQWQSEVLELSFGSEGTERLTGVPAYSPGRLYMMTAEGALNRHYERIVRRIKRLCTWTYQLVPRWNVYIFAETAAHIRRNELKITAIITTNQALDYSPSDGV